MENCLCTSGGQKNSENECMGKQEFRDEGI